MQKIFLFVMLLLFLIPTPSIAENSINSIPKSSERFDNPQNTPNLVSHYFGIDSQGNTSVLRPNHSGGYIGFDNQGKALIITPLRGNLGVDSNGNTWTIRSK